MKYQTAFGAKKRRPRQERARAELACKGFFIQTSHSGGRDGGRSSSCLLYHENDTGRGVPAETPGASKDPAHGTEERGGEGEPSVVAEGEKTDRAWAAPKEPSLAPQAPQEIALRVSDKEKALSEFYAVVQQYGGEMVGAEGNILFVSLPVHALTEFEKELSMQSSLEKATGTATKTDADKSLSAEAKKKEQEGRGPSARPAPRKEGRIVLRIVLIQE